MQMACRSESYCRLSLHVPETRCIFQEENATFAAKLPDKFNAWGDGTANVHNNDPCTLVGPSLRSLSVRS
jgi:hypothetical protein